MGVGIRKDSDLSLEELYTVLTSLKSKGRKLTVKDALEKYPKYEPLEKPYKEGNRNISHKLIENNDFTHHNCRYSNLRDQMVFEEWISKNMNEASTEEKQNFYTHL